MIDKLYAPISVVLPAHNEEEWIKTPLEALLKQTVLPREVIIVDNASTDGTADIAKKFATPFENIGVSFRVLYESKLGVANARNCGWFAAKQPIIASTDADTILPDNWIETIINCFEMSNADAISGKTVCSDASWLVNKLTLLVFPIYSWITKRLYGFQSFSTANCAVKKETFIDAGGFNSSAVHPDDLDDMELASKIAVFGQVKYLGSLVVGQSIRRSKSLIDLFMTQRRRIKSIVRIVSAHRRLKK